MASDFENLYVTYVDVDGDLLKVWGQRNRIGATYIERQLLQMVPDFNRTSGPDPSRILKGMFCFAKYTDDNYYRARVISDVQGDSVGVLFVDYGNRDFIKISNLRVQQSNEDVLTKMSEQAEEYYLARVMAPQFGWTKEVVGEIRHDICYDEFRSRVVAHFGNLKIVEIVFHNEDFSNYIIKKQIARPLELAEQKKMIISYCSLVSKSEALKEKISFSSSIPPQNLQLLKPHNSLTESDPFHFNRSSHPINFSKPPPPFHYPPSRHVSPMFQQMDKSIPKNSLYSQGARMTNPVSVNTMSLVNTVMNPLLKNHGLYQMKDDAAPQFNNVIEILAQQVKQYIAQDNAKSGTVEDKEPHHFVNSVLEVGNNYNVFISHIDDGPWSFSIQLVSSETELQKLMEELSSIKLVPIKPPIILGHPCIAASKLYGNLCRGVIVSLSHSSVKVYFVDFGNTEDLPSSSIYELPSKFFKTRVLSQKFSLHGLEKVTYSDDIKKFFKEVVQDELLMLRVASLKADNLPTCELYFKDKNIKRILNEKIRELRGLNKDDFPKVGDTEDVVVTWIVSPQKFFVQLHKRDLELNELKKELAEIGKKAQKIPSHQLAVGLRCICLYESDGLWYRGVITDIDSENDITVFYVDYGNTEKVNVSNLRKIDGSCLINQLKPQAIQCCLKGFENKALDQEINNKLEELILEKELRMKVASSERELLCVQLFDGKNDVSLSLFAKASAKIDMKGGNSPTSSQMNQLGINQWDYQPLQNYRPDYRNFQNDKTSGEYKGNARGDKSFSNRFMQDRANQRNDRRPGRSGRDHSQENGNEGSRGSHRGNWDNRNSKTFEEDIDGKRFNGSKRFEKGNRIFNSENSKNSIADDRPDIKFDQPRRTRKPIRQEDIAPPGSRFEEKTVNIGTCERCIITYFFSPHEFYVQLLDQENEFKKMMQDIQVYYSDKYSLRNPVQTGDIVIAQFSLDKILYRAEVIRPIPVTVRYVDYGNREPVASNGIWAVDKQFLNLPQQVVQCRLSNIQPVDSDWPPPGSAVDIFFEKEEYTCTFVDHENGVYEVILKAVGSETDVATEIIAAGLGQPTTVATADVPKIDYSLLPNQALRLYLTHVVSSSKFYVIIDLKRAEMVHNKIKAYVESHKALTPIKKNLINPGKSCLTTLDGNSWCRGIITKVEESTVSIWFSDRGDDIELAAEKVKELPNHLAEIEPLAMECCLDEITAVDEEVFKSKVEYKHHLVFIVSAVGNKLSVVLFNEDGQKSEFQKHTNHSKAIQPIGDLPLLTQKLPLIVSHVDSPNCFYIQRSCDWDDLSLLTNQLSEFYDGKEKEDFDFKEIGQFVAAKSVEYELWYRGQVMSCSDDGFEVFYLDYGNKEILPRDNVKKLDESFLKFFRFAKKVTLDIDVSEDVKEQVKNKLLEITLDQELVGFFVNDGGEFVCELLLNNERISRMFKMESVVNNKIDKFDFLSVNSIEPGPPVEELPHNEIEERIPEESHMKVFISHIDSPKQFWVHKESMMYDLQQLQEKLQKISETLPEKKSLTVGDSVVAVFSGAWYRAKIVSIEGTNLTVQFIDYGNTVVIDTTESPVKELTPELVEVPLFATHYALHGHWNVNATAKFEEIILSSEDPVSIVILEKGEPVLVDLIQNGKSICEKLTEEGVACEKDENDLSTVYLTHVTSPSDFYIQRVAASDKLYIVTERLLEAGSFKSPSEVKVNEIYVARFPEDGLWYRAKVVEKFPNEYKVFFIDFGNTCNTNEIRELPADLTNIPSLIKHCSLIRGQTFDVWSEAACQKFAEYVDGHEFQMKVVVNRSEKSIVKLFYEGKNITEELGKLCEGDGRSEVFVTHAISPTEFYVKYVNDELYEKVAKKLEDVNNFEDLEERHSGAFCVARFVDDGCWYRAKILKIVDGGYEVLFIDFGNVSVSNELKNIPPELKEISPRALKCSFDLRETDIPECVKEEFLNLLLDSDSIFRARIITSGEVNVVSLKLNGRILEETLWNEYVPVCEDQVPNSVAGTDDDKNSKLRNSYLNFENDSRGNDSVTNETDEEKRVKIGITVGDEGFKCDDEKGSEALPTVVNATDNELMEGSEKGDEEPDILESAEEIPETPEPTPEVPKETQTENENRGKFVRNKAQKIVPGSISRGEEEKTLCHSPETTWKKLQHSEKVVPGSISRGVSLEYVSEPGDCEPAPRQISQSAPSTPKFSRRQHTTSYVKVSSNERLVPGCISTGIPLQVSPFVEKIPSVEKIVPGAVNGSFADVLSPSRDE